MTSNRSHIAVDLPPDDLALLDELVEERRRIVRQVDPLARISRRGVVRELILKAIGRAA